jgi:hypothetical protein
MLIVLGGLPGTGKTSIARAFSQATSAVHTRLDSIEQAIRESGVTVVSLDDAGYRAGYAVAEDSLRLGHLVVADSVNPVPITRGAWLDVARRAHPRNRDRSPVRDQAEHRRRIDARLLEGSGPTWQQVVHRDYRPWPTAAGTFDTSRLTIDQVVAELRTAIGVCVCRACSLFWPAELDSTRRSHMKQALR